MYWSLILITFRETYFLRGGTRLISKGFSHSLDDKRQYLVPEWLLKQANIVSAPWYRHCWCMQRLICTCSCCLNPLCVFFGFILTLFFVGQVWVWFEWGEHHRARPLLGRYGHQLTHAGWVNHFFLCVCNQTPISVFVKYNTVESLAYSLGSIYKKFLIPHATCCERY